jgi:hypothetical protein
MKYEADKIYMFLLELVNHITCCVDKRFAVCMKSPTTENAPAIGGVIKTSKTAEVDSVEKKSLD